MASLAMFTGGISPHAVLDAWGDWFMHLSRAPGRQLELVEHAGANWLKLGSYALGCASRGAPEKPFAPASDDPRWLHGGWNALPFSLWQQGFLGLQDWVMAATADMPGLRKRNAARVGTMSRLMLDTVSPSNFPCSNPEIIEATLASGGENLTSGAAHFLDDARHVLLRERRPIPEQFALGKVLAATPGSIVFRNDLMELIQYAPVTGRVRPEPILIVPAWIMKYYILDLSRQNSLIRWLVERGYTVFCISWRNPGAEQASLGLDDYRTKGVLQALQVIDEITAGQQVHTVGYCLGGTLLAIAAAAMAREGDRRLASVTLIAAQVDFAEAGELLLFLDESQVAFLEDMMWAQGFLDRPQMSGAFALIRAEDLIWTRGVRRYFLGEPDLPTDITVWVNDTTRMPARMHSEYLRGIFLENRITAGRFAVEGRVIALKDITAPIFVIATEHDHIAPWRSVYKTLLFTDCDARFLLTNGGHNTGVLSPPGHPRRRYRLSHRRQGESYVDPDRWFEAQTVQDGSWWPAWGEWLDTHSGRPTRIGLSQEAAERYPVLGPAPGTYVHQM